ncbi:MAG: hypothetical protein AAFO63_12100 [Pseudomonadota bacterium]
MLFLLNSTIMDVPSPEIHLRSCWRRLGCGLPEQMRAQDAIAFVQLQVEQALKSSDELEGELALDLASLVIAKTGANSLTFQPTPSGRLEPRLRHIPRLVLETYWQGAANDSPHTLRVTG